jgi:hypothetical protein
MLDVNRVPNIKFNTAKVLQSMIPIVDSTVSSTLPGIINYFLVLWYSLAGPGTLILTITVSDSSLIPGKKCIPIEARVVR